MDDGYDIQHYPQGEEWHCPDETCDFTCDDDGPDYCPTHNLPMTRLKMTLILPERLGRNGHG